MNNSFKQELIATKLEKEQIRNNLFNKIITNKKAIIKLQQRNDVELSDEEKLKILKELFDNNLNVFLEKYWPHFNTNEYLKLIQPKTSKENELFNYYLNKINEPLNKKKSKIKNRRYEALQRLIKQGDYFSDESMKSREPLLYSNMIEKFNTQIVDLEPTASQVGVLSSFLMRTLENMNHTERVNRLKENEIDEREEEEISDEEKDESEYETDEDENQISHDEKQKYRQDFIQIMYNKFLNGEDVNFDYETVDFNEEYDDLNVLNQDQQDKYFDDEEENQLDTSNYNIEYDY
jgi:hypothetical protein